MVSVDLKWFTSVGGQEPLREAAYYGLAGDVVRLLAPHTESDPVALLVQFLVYFGAVVGPGPHFMHEDTRHRLNLYAVLVGPSGHARKGTSKDRIQAVFEAAEPGWAAEHSMGGLSSGEGLIAALADREGGSTDKRTLVVEPEFAGPLQHMSRDGNILSIVLREAWDRADLRTTTRRDPLRASGTYVCLAGHITGDDLARHMTATLAGNGLGNRILWAVVKRAPHLLPFGGELRPDGWERLVSRLRQHINDARQVGSMGMTEAAQDLWRKAYPVLTAERTGLFGKLTGRAEAQTRRLTCLYALLDGQAVANAHHLQAALAVWEYCEASVAVIFGDATGMKLADTILQQLRGAGSAGLTRTGISDALGHNRASAAIGDALAQLRELGLARVRLEPPVRRGRKPVERWLATQRARTHVATKYELNEVMREATAGQGRTTTRAVRADPCSVCGAESARYGADGTAYCESHAPEEVA
jgi:hypothetical protein